MNDKEKFARVASDLRTEEQRQYMITEEESDYYRKLLLRANPLWLRSKTVETKSPVG